MWQIPKTNWQPHDFENVEDLNRQKNNLIWVMQNILPQLGYTPPEPVQHPDFVENQNIFVESLRTLEANIDILFDFVQRHQDVDWHPARMWSEQMINNTISYEDFNRWERNAAAVYQLLQRFVGEYKYSGEAVAGEDDWL